MTNPISLTDTINGAKGQARAQLALLYAAAWEQAHEDGSEAQIETENALFTFMQEELGIDEETCLEACIKATLDERLEWALQTGLCLIATSDVG